MTSNGFQQEATPSASLNGAFGQPANAAWRRIGAARQAASLEKFFQAEERGRAQRFM
jgi:hypothetical protein